MRVPFFDVGHLNHRYREALQEAFDRVMASGQYILDQEVRRFESEWAEYCQRKYAVGFGNATEALSALLLAHGIGHGDRVIVPAHTCIATWLAVSEIGAVPIAVDVDVKTFNLEASGFLYSKCRSVCAKAIIAVAMYGRAVDVEALRDIAVSNGIPLLLDAAQAHGLRGYQLADGAVFSFYPTKNLGALGDGGAVVIDDSDVAGRLRMLRNLGSSAKDVHMIQGGNSRLDELQAAFLQAKLPTLDYDNGLRVRNAKLYGLPENAESVWHQCVIMSDCRGELMHRLDEIGVGTMVHYPKPPHLQHAFSYLGYREGDFPAAELIAKRGLSLPCNPGLTEEQVIYAASHISEALEEVHG